MSNQKQKRIIAIGDIHGEYKKLENIFLKLDLQTSDTVVFLGDYIDRGFYSKQVVEKLIEMSKYCHCEFLIGNHEYYLLRAFNNNAFAKDFFYKYGGNATVASYGSFDNILKTHSDFFNNLKYYYLTENYLFVHAGIRPDLPLEQQDYFDMIMIRDNFINHGHQLKQKVVFGHTPFKIPLIENDKIGIDTGCGKYPNAPLTAYICNENKFISAI